MTWDTVSLGDIALQRGGSVDPKKHPDEVFELYSIPAFDAGAPEITTGSEIGSSKKAVQPNDIMISRIVPHIRRACVVGQANGHRQIASSEWIIFRDENIWPQYLRWVLVGDVFHWAFMRTVSGVGGSLLRARPAEVFKIKIPLPPLAEQKRIAEILDAADALRAKRRESLAKLDTLLQSTFLDMFGDPVTNPMGWQDNVVLGEVAGIVSGLTKGRKLRDQATREVPYLAVVNVQDRHIVLEPLKRILATEGEIQRYSLKNNDLLMTEGGDPDKLGRGALWHEEVDECIHQNHVFRVRLHDDRLQPVFLNWLVGSQRGKRYFLRQAKQTTGIATINLTQLRKFPLLIPRLDLQHRFAAIVDSVELQKATQRTHLDELDTLFASLQSRAFQGVL